MLRASANPYWSVTQDPEFTEVVDVLEEMVAVVLEKIEVVGDVTVVVEDSDVVVDETVLVAEEVTSESQISMPFTLIDVTTGSELVGKLYRYPISFTVPAFWLPL